MDESNSVEGSSVSGPPPDLENHDMDGSDNESEEDNGIDVNAPINDDEIDNKSTSSNLDVDNQSIESAVDDDNENDNVNTPNDDDDEMDKHSTTSNLD
eukprot:6729637-Ditylum_brightwellii.AAC.1